VVAELRHHHYDANELKAKVHDRMPVILHPGRLQPLARPRLDPDRPPIDLLRPFPPDEMQAFVVSKDVGNVKNNSPELRIVSDNRDRELATRLRQSNTDSGNSLQTLAPLQIP
jgi:hypothetical protein